MAHDHSHGAGHSHSVGNYGKAFAIGIALNTLFVAGEAFYGFSANSLALLSDAGHNLSDVMGLLLAWGAIRLSKSRPTKRRTSAKRALVAIGGAGALASAEGERYSITSGQFAKAYAAAVSGSESATG